MTICEYIDGILKVRGISRRKLAITAGIPPSSLQSAFQRNGKLSYDMLIPIARVLGIDEDLLLNLTFIDEDERSEYAAEIVRSRNDEQQAAAEVFIPQAEEALTEKNIEKAISCMNAIIQAAPDIYPNLHFYQELRAFVQGIKEKALLRSFRFLNDDGQTVAVERVTELTEIRKYQKGHLDPPIPVQKQEEQNQEADLSATKGYSEDHRTVV